jgi:hypothetical protein
MKIAKSALLIVFVAAFFLGCREAEIELLCKQENAQGQFAEIYLVKNHPKNERDLNELLREFNQDLITSTWHGSRTFLKEHSRIDYVFTFGDKIDYEKNGCEEIDNMDMLCSVSKVKFQSGGDTIIFYYFE